MRERPIFLRCPVAAFFARTPYIISANGRMFIMSVPGQERTFTNVHITSASPPITDQQGGNLGQIARGDTVPEFERAIFRLDAHGILHGLIKMRHGFHIVAVDTSIPGKTLPFEAVRDQIVERLKASVEERALRQYVSILAYWISANQYLSVSRPLRRF
jgi:hypothetical protein